MLHHLNSQMVNLIHECKNHIKTLGYQTAEFRKLTIRDTTFEIELTLEDDFQESLEYSDRFYHGYLHTLYSGNSISDARAALYSLPSRKDRELTILLRAIAKNKAIAGDMSGEFASAFVASLEEKAAEYKNLLTYQPTTNENQPTTNEEVNF